MRIAHPLPERFSIRRSGILTDREFITQRNEVRASHTYRMLTDYVLDLAHAEQDLRTDSVNAFRSATLGATLVFENATFSV